MAMTAPEQVTREEIKELIDEYEHGKLIVADVEPIPTIGEVPADEHEFRSEIRVYEWGDIEEQFRP